MSDLPLGQAFKEPHAALYTHDLSMDEAGNASATTAKHIFFDDESNQAQRKLARRYKIASRDCHLYNHADMFAAYRSWEGHTGFPKKDVPRIFTIAGPVRSADTSDA